uniref:Uncharacterized protein n=1 Tax=Megaselia scalaris TaxID=36166 RepID=T1H4F3_MEGSC
MENLFNINYINQYKLKLCVETLRTKAQKHSKDIFRIEIRSWNKELGNTQHCPFCYSHMNTVLEYCTNKVFLAHLCVDI